MVAANKIQWDNAWGTDVVTQISSGLRFDGPYEVSDLIPAADPISDECNAPF